MFLLLTSDLIRKMTDHLILIQRFCLDLFELPIYLSHCFFNFFYSCFVLIDFCLQTLTLHDRLGCNFRLLFSELVTVILYLVFVFRDLPLKAQSELFGLVLVRKLYALNPIRCLHLNFSWVCLKLLDFLFQIIVSLYLHCFLSLYLDLSHALLVKFKLELRIDLLFFAYLSFKIFYFSVNCPF